MSWPKGKKFSEDHKRKIGEAHLGKHLSKDHCEAIRDGMQGTRLGKNNPMYGIHMCGEDAPFYGKHHSPKARAKCKVAKLGKKNPMYGQSTYTCAIYDENLQHYIHSGWEHKVCTFLKDFNIYYEYEATRFILGDSTWAPDIKFNEQLYLEVKGYLKEDPKWKILRFLKEHPDKTLILLGGNSAIHKIQSGRNPNVISIHYDKEGKWEYELLENINGW